MKIAKIRTIFKKGDRYDCSNHRPISILSVFSKFLEKLIYNILILFVNKIIYCQMLSTGLEISQLKGPVKFLLKISRNLTRRFIF